jgi:alkylation response protein AidB-like acyl-CoA dehydrogenase
MSAVRQNPPSGQTRIDPVALVNELGRRFAARAAEHDATDGFAAENYAELKARGVFAAGIPEELGGAGATYLEICDMLRMLAQHCSSTALALAMHTHLVVAIVWRWRRDPLAVEAFRRRIVNERLVLISTGASDWLNGSGKAERVEGGWRVNARKIFGSGVPAGDFLMTGAVCDDPEAGATVLHFPLSLKAEGVRVLDTCQRHRIARHGDRGRLCAGQRNFGAAPRTQVAPAPALGCDDGMADRIRRLSRHRRSGPRPRRRARPDTSAR